MDSSLVMIDNLLYTGIGMPLKLLGMPPEHLDMPPEPLCMPPKGHGMPLELLGMLLVFTAGVGLGSHSIEPPFPVPSNG